MLKNQSKKSTRTLKQKLQQLYYILLSAASILLVLGSKAVAQSFSTQGNTAVDWLATTWMLVAGALVFFMNAGFAMLEAGFCRTSNAVNVLAKNLMVFCVAAIAYWLVGFGLMFGDGDSFAGHTGFLFEFIFPNQKNPLGFPAGFSELAKAWNGHSFVALFFFQLVFAGTGATIISGAVAERIRFWAFIIFTFILIAILYPLSGHWAWAANGWLLNAWKFRDFAGSTVVHSVGGAAALVGAWLMKPRDGRFGYNYHKDDYEEQETRRFLPYNLGFATLGCFILWLGWFGFNGGSASNIEYVPSVIGTTMMAGATGGVSALIFYPVMRNEKPQLGSVINGVLGGLVGITASSGYVNIGSSIIIGGMSGIVVIGVELLLEKFKIDDPVGAVPVHLGCGWWGTMAVGLFSSPASLEYAGQGLFHQNLLQQLLFQFLGWAVIISFTIFCSFWVWALTGYILYQLFESSNLTNTKISFWQKVVIGLRVSEADEVDGSDGTFADPKLKYKLR